MKIALDVDGVLADVIVSWLLHNNKTRKRLTKNQLTDWDFWKSHNIDRYDFYNELSLCWKNWRTIPATEKDLSDTTKKLSEFGSVDIVTAREKATSDFVKQWLDFYDISFDNYVSVTDGRLKADLDYDLFIDDSPLNVQKFLQKNKSTILYSQPWNAHISDPKVIRISSLKEIFTKINSIFS